MYPLFLTFTGLACRDHNVLSLFTSVHGAGLTGQTHTVVQLIVYARTVASVKRWCGRMICQGERGRGRLTLRKTDCLGETILVTVGNA
jgi:hypothetical protein